MHSIKITVFALLSGIVFLILHSKSDAAGRSCVPGTEWFSECSHCHCPPSGENPICEEVGCPVCKVGHRWRMNCNPCFCLKGGQTICRMMSMHNCDVEPDMNKDRGCIVGKKWNSGCNKCFCTENGYTACTERECSSVGFTMEKKECEPGRIWLEGCKMCICTSEGHKACESRSCHAPVTPTSSPTIAPHPNVASPTPVKLCKPRTMWKEDCNRCICTSYHEVYCTKKNCDAPVTQIAATVPPPAGVTTTVRAAPPTLPTISNVRSTVGGKCRPRDRWEEGCSTCHCSDEGVPICVGVMCRPADEEKSGGEENGGAWRPETGPKIVEGNVEGGGEAEAPVPYAAVHGGKNRREEEASLHPRMYRPSRRGVRVSEDTLYTPKKRMPWSTEVNSEVVDEEASVQQKRREHDSVERVEMKRGVEEGDDEETRRKERRLFYKPSKRVEIEEKEEKQGGSSIQKRMFYEPSQRGEPHFVEEEKEEEIKAEEVNAKDEEENVEMKSTESHRRKYIHHPLRRKRDATSECVPDDEWTNDCNVCVCNSHGIAVCTKMSCEGVPSKPWLWRVASTQSLPRCEAPFDVVVVEDDCNACVCNGRRLPVCTQMECPGRHVEKGVVSAETEVVQPPLQPSSPSPLEMDACRPGSRWTIDCRECRCDEQQREICEQLEPCEDEEVEEESKEEPKRLQRGRVDLEIREKEQRESIEGREREQRESVEGRTKKKAKSLTCQPGVEWREKLEGGCGRSCRCNEDGVPDCMENRCRRREEVYESEEEAMEARTERMRCKPHSEWMEKCNRCTCSSEGRKQCTEMNCDNFGR